MVADEIRSGSGSFVSLPMRFLPVTRSLSARLLVLTILFVMLAEVLIYTPSIARFRMSWLDEKLAAGHLAALAIVAAPEGMVTMDLQDELLRHVGARMIDLRIPGSSTYMVGSGPVPEIDRIVDMRERGFITLIADAFETLGWGGQRILKVVGASPRDPAAYIELVLDDAPLKAAMLDYSERILGLSVVISLIAAGLVFVALRRLLVAPLTQLADKMTAFRDDPDDANSIVVPSGRADEIGVAQQQLHDMQTALRAALKQKARLAALGTGVTRINHDLRNILSTASLLSERLAMSGDPEVRRTTPRLLDALDRAVDLCQHTLSYTREGGPPVERSTFPLRELVDLAAAELAPIRDGRTVVENRVPAGLTVRADRRQLLRVLVNLGRNAVEAGAGTIVLDAEEGPDGVSITVADDGPGLPQRARAHLFQPFAGASRPGGTGLGLAIAREIMVAHRGDLSLVETTGRGTCFRLDLPG